MILKDKPNRLAIWLMIGVVKYMLRHFRKLSFIGDITHHPDKATLMLMNHFSFNDGAVLHYLARTILQKKFKVMVLEAQLKAFGILRYIGGFSINKKSKTVLESLGYAAELLKDPHNMLGIFPQGEVFSMHLNRIHFENGLSLILKKSKDVSFQIIFGVTLLDYLDGFKPHARVYLEEYDGEHDLMKMEDAYNQFYKKCKLQQQLLHHPPTKVLDELNGRNSSKAIDLNKL